MRSRLIWALSLVSKLQQLVTAIKIIICEWTHNFAVTIIYRGLQITCKQTQGISGTFWTKGSTTNYIERTCPWW
jgi:hypothetical protein